MISHQFLAAIVEKWVVVGEEGIFGIVFDLVGNGRPVSIKPFLEGLTLRLHGTLSLVAKLRAKSCAEEHFAYMMAAGKSDPWLLLHQLEKMDSACQMRKKLLVLIPVRFGFFLVYRRFSKIYYLSDFKATNHCFSQSSRLWCRR